MATTKTSPTVRSACATGGIAVSSTAASPAPKSPPRLHMPWKDDMTGRP